MTLLSIITVAATLFMLVCVVGLTIQLNVLARRLRKQEEDAAFYRSWAFRLALSQVENLFEEELR